LKNPALLRLRGVSRIGGVLLAGAPGTGEEAVWVLLLLWWWWWWCCGCVLRQVSAVCLGVQNNALIDLNGTRQCINAPPTPPSHTPPPGKTLLAKAIAAESGVKMFTCSGERCVCAACVCCLCVLVFARNIRT
jgi:hypothetical protein